MQKIKGSALAYSLIILAIMLFIVGSVSFVSITEKKKASSTDFSTQAYQTADSGFQITLKAINANSGKNLNYLASQLGASVTCTTDASGNAVINDVPGAGPTNALYTLSFGTSGSDKSCAAIAGTVTSIKSIGTYKNTTRAVEVSVSSASGPCSASTTCGTSCTYNGDTYSTVQLGAQCWFRENLRTTKDSNGNSIARLCYNDGASHQDSACTETKSSLIYGGLYTWATATNQASSCNVTSCTPASPQGICPTGWHIPTDAEWTTLINHPYNGTQLQNTSSSDFSGILAGGHYSDFYSRDSVGTWWSINQDNPSFSGEHELHSGDSAVYRYSGSKSLGLSVRCLRD